MSIRNFVLFATFLVALHFLLVDSSKKVTSSNLPTCGFVFDGSKPLVDIDHQAGSSFIRANWAGFDGFVPPPVKATTGKSTTGTTGKGSSTRKTLRGIEVAQAGSTGGSTGGTTGGTTGGKASTFDGVSYEVAIISEKEALAPILASGWNASSATRCRSTPGNFGVPDTLQFTSANPHVLTGTNGLKVFEWRSPSLHLVKKVHYYVIVKATSGGRTIYSNSNGVQVGNPSSSSDNHEFPAYKAGLIAMGIAIYCLLLLLLLIILIAVGAGKKDDKYTTTVHRNENVEKV